MCCQKKRVISDCIRWEKNCLWKRKAHCILLFLSISHVEVKRYFCILANNMFYSFEYGQLGFFKIATVVFSYCSWGYHGKNTGVACHSLAPILWLRRADSLEKILTLGKIEDRRRRGRQKMRWLIASLTQWTWIWANSGIVEDRGAWLAAVHRVIRSRTQLLSTEQLWYFSIIPSKSSKRIMTIFRGDTSFTLEVKDSPP